MCIGNAWTSASAAAVNRLRSRALGAPLVLSSFSHRLSLGLGATGMTAGRESTAVLDLALSRANAKKDGSSVEEVISVELDRAALAGFLERLDAIQQQLDSLS